MSYTIAAITDIHAAGRNPVQNPNRRSALAAELLLRAVERINREIKPDVTLILGDVVDDGHSQEAPTIWRRLQQVIDHVQSPVIVIPGNHDGDEEAFYREMPRPAQTMEIGGVRFLPFIDQQEPDYQARRTAEDLLRTAHARDGFTRPIVAVQHVPLLPPGVGASPYRLLNDAEAIAAMHAGEITLAISGHFHQGDTLIRHETGAFLVVPAFCEPPFPFLEITLDSEITVTRHELGALADQL